MECKYLMVNPNLSYPSATNYWICPPFGFRPTDKRMAHSDRINFFHHRSSWYNRIGSKISRRSSRLNNDPTSQRGITCDATCSEKRADDKGPLHISGAA